jgi:hypothetical protein
VKMLVTVLAVLLLTTACGSVDRSAAIATCGAFASMNDTVPNPRAGQPLRLPPGFPTISGFDPIEPDFIGPGETDLRNRIAAARSFAAASQDNDLQRLADALRISRDGNGRPIVVVPTLFLDYCRQNNY